MKTICFILMLLTLDPMLLQATDRPSKPDTSYCLAIEGKVLNAAEGDSDCKVELILNNVVVDSLYLHGKKKFKFDLKRNSHYVIRVTKAGYQPKSVCIHTTIGSQYRELYQFTFETSLSEIPARDSLHVKPAVSNSTVAKIFFDEKKGCFYYSKSYNVNARKDLCPLN